MMNVGDRVRAIIRVLEDGPGGEPDPDAAPCTYGWIHAEPGEFGTVLHIEKGVHPTIRWDRTKTATIAMEGVEFELLPRSG